MYRNPINLINTYLPNLSKSEQKIGHYILENYEIVTQITIKELADLIGVSQSSIIRFSKSTGYSGFRELKIAFAFHANNESPSTHYDDLVVEEKSYEYIIKTYLQGNIANLQENLTELNFEELEEIAKLFLEKDHIFLVGAGYSGNVASGMYLKLKTIFSNVHIATNDFDALQDSYLLNKNSLVFAISQTGTSQNTLALTKKANEVGATSVCLTASYNNELYNMADHTIVPTASFQNVGSSYLATEIMFKIFLDCIVVYAESHTQGANSPLADYL